MKRPANKYGARQTPCASGHTHASRKEARRCNELGLLRQAGQIRDLVIEPQFWFVIDGKQVKHLNGRRVGYRPDFRYTQADGRQVAEDVKGGQATRTEAYALRSAIFRALFPDVELREV